MKNLVKLLLQDIKHITFREILLSFELIVMLVLIYMCGGVIRSGIWGLRDTDMYLRNDILVCDSLNPEEVEFCENNGELLGSVRSIEYKNGNGCIYTRKLIEEFPIEVSSGTWFSEGEGEYELMAVIPESRKAQYKVGEIYDIEFVLRHGSHNLETLEYDPEETVTLPVYICGVMESETFLAEIGINNNPDYTIFFDINKSIGELTYQGYPNDYYLLTSDEKNLPVATLEMFIEDLKYSSLQALFPFLMLGTVLAVLFFSGFIGQHIMDLQRLKKKFAVQFVCGGSRRFLITEKLVGDFIRFIIPIGISFFVQYLLPKQTINSVWPAFSAVAAVSVLVIVMIVSFVESYRILKDCSIHTIYKER